MGFWVFMLIINEAKQFHGIANGLVYWQLKTSKMLQDINIYGIK